MQIRKIHRRSKELTLDLTPLIDCVFLLLIFFMVGTQLIEKNSSLKIELPKSSVVEINEIKDLILYMDKDKNIEINFVNNEGKRVVEKIEKDKLETTLTEKFNLTQEKSVVIKADKTLTHGDVVELMTIAKKSGATALDIATESEK